MAMDDDQASVRERLTEIARRLEAITWGFFEAAPHDLGERWRHLRRQWRRFVLQNRVRGLQRRIALEGSPTRKHFIQHGPYGKDIRAAVGGTSANLLGCHVTHRT